MFEMRADLVGSAGFQFTFHPGHVFKSFDDFVMGNRVFAETSVRENRHLHPVFQVSSDVSCNRSFIVGHISPYKCPVKPFGGPVEKLFRQETQRILIFGDNQKSGSIFVDPVHEPYPVEIRFLAVLFEMKRQRVHQCSRIIAVTWMNDHTGIFVYYHQIIIFIHDVDGNILRDDDIFPGRMGQQH